MNAIGIASALLLVAAWLAAAVLFFKFDLVRVLRARAGEPFWTWADVSARRQFLTFIVVCALGPLAVFVGILFGNWPTR